MTELHMRQHQIAQLAQFAEKRTQLCRSLDALLQDAENPYTGDVRFNNIPFRGSDLSPTDYTSIQGILVRHVRTKIAKLDAEVLEEFGITLVDE